MIKGYLEYLNESLGEQKFDSDDLIEVPNDIDNTEYDSITISDKMENRLKELKVKQDLKIDVGDIIFVRDKNKGKLPDKVFDFLNSKEFFKVLRINDKKKLDIGFYQRYIRKTDNKKIKKVFYFNSRRFQKIDTLDKVAQFILGLKHIEKSNLLEFPVDYLDVDDKGNISCLSRRHYEEGTDPFKSKRRTILKLNRMLTRITTREYYDNNLNQRDIEIFLNKWRMLFDDSYTIKILEGDDILDAYDCDTISGGWRSSSCANFSGNREKNSNKFKVYTENTENIKCLVVYHKGKIHGRSMMFVGIQTHTHGKFKAGEEYILLNYMYGEGGRGSKVDQLIKRWARDNGAFNVNDMRLGRDDIFRIKIKKTCYKMYPPWDTMVVNFKTNEIASRVPNKENGWHSAYGARCNL